MNFMGFNLKKACSLLLSAAVVSGVTPAYAVHTKSTFDEETRNYLYTNTYDTSVENGNLGFETALTKAPDDGENSVMHITDANGTGSAQDGYNTIVLSGIAGGWNSTPTYESLGADENKPIIFEADIYLPDGMLDEVSDFRIGGPLIGQIWDKYTAGTMIISKKTDASYGVSTGDAVKELAANQWYNIKFMYSFTTRKWESYIDDVSFAAGTASDWQKLIFSSVAMGIKIQSKGEPLTTGFYVDNSAMYQYNEQEISYGIEDGAVDIVPEDGISVDLGVSIPVSKLGGLFTVTKDGAAKTGTIIADGETGVTLFFTGLEENTEYTIDFAGYSGIEAILSAKSVSFTTKAPTDMTVSADIKDGAELAPGDNTIKLTFSQKVSADTVSDFITLTDEENMPVSFTCTQSDDYEIAVNMTSLPELTGYTLVISSALTSDTGLPLRDELMIGFRTKQYGKPIEEDPYKPGENNDTVILSNDDMGEKWYLTESDSEASYDSGITTLSAANTEKDSVFYPKSDNKYTARESNSGMYSEKTEIIFDYDMKIPDKSAAAKYSVDFAFECTTTSSAIPEWKDVGAWTPTFRIEYQNGSGIRMYKTVVSSKAVQLFTDAEVSENEWLHIRGKVDMETGIITVYKLGGTALTIDMNLSPGWGDNDKYYMWGKYMYLKQVYFSMKPADGNTSAVNINNMDVRRISNTLSVLSSSFEHNEYYVDTNNITLEFNDELDRGELENALYVTDEDGSNVACDISVSGDGSVFTLSIQGLLPYTRYTLNIDNLQARSLRKMSEKFSRSFVTKKNSRIFVDTQDENAVLNTFGKRLSKADKIEYTAVLKNEGDTQEDICGALAVYGENDSLIAVSFRELSEGQNKFEISGMEQGTVCVRIFAWYKKDGKIAGLLHKPDVLQGVEFSSAGKISNDMWPQFNVSIADSVLSTINVSGKTADNDGVYTIIVLDGEDTPLTEAYTKTLALYHTDVNSGEYTAEFGFNGPSAKYTVYVINNTDAAKGIFEYIKLSDLTDQYIKKLHDGEIAQSEIYNKTVEFNAGIGIDFTKDFISERDRKLFEKRMYQRRGLLIGPSDLEYAAQLQANIEYAKDEIKYLNELEAVTYYGVVKDKLDEGLIYTGISYDKYQMLTDTQKAYVLSAFIGKTFADGDEVKVFFDKKVAEAGNISQGSSNVGGSGGGGGGGSGGNSSAKNNASVVLGGISGTPQVTAAKDVFSDMTGYEWAEDAVLYLAKRGIISGVSESKFDPAGLVTREQFAKLVVLAADLYNANANESFEDAESDAWYISYISSAKKNGIVNGIEESKFGVGMYITREDMAVMLYKAFEAKNIKLTNYKSDFDDMDKISEYAYTAVAALSGAGIINGVGNNKFDPKSNATRAEAAILIKALEEGVN